MLVPGRETGFVRGFRSAGHGRSARGLQCRFGPWQGSDPGHGPNGHSTALSRAVSAQAEAATSSEASDDLSTTSTVLPSAENVGYEPTRTVGWRRSSSRSTSTIRLSLVTYVRRHEPIGG